MPHRSVSLRRAQDESLLSEIHDRIDALLVEAEDLPVEFPSHVLAAAEEAAGDMPQEDRVDLTDIPFVTLDPASSTDLDQAMHLEQTDGGFRVRYAIADVPAFVELDGPVDAEARRRGRTVYLPDRRISLHPEVLCEGAASLLPEQTRPAFVWDLTLDAQGAVQSVDLQRALVRSTAKLAYDEVQEQLDAGTAPEQMMLLQRIGALRAELELARGGASLKVPEQRVETEGDQVRLTWRRPAVIEDANAQISLMTGMAAAQMMLEGGIGILRTMPPADEAAVTRFRRQCAALGMPWPQGQPYGEFLRTLDWREGTHLALLNQAASLFRGAAYEAFTSAEQIPENTRQAAIAAPYAHATAPLRRLVDRFVLLVCHAHARRERPAADLVAALGTIPETMRATAGRAADLERRALQIVESAVLSRRADETFTGTVIDRREATTAAEGEVKPLRVEIQLRDPSITLWAPGMDAKIGQEVRVRLGEPDGSGRPTAVPVS